MWPLAGSQAHATSPGRRSGKLRPGWGEVGWGGEARLIPEPQFPPRPLSHGRPRWGPLSLAPQPPGRVPPVPERRASLPDPSEGGSRDTVYAELRRVTPAGSQACAPDPGAQRRGRDGGGQLRPAGRGPPLSPGTPAPSPPASPAPWSRLLLPEAPGPSAAPRSQGSPRPSPRAQPSSPDTYTLIRTAGSLEEEAGDEPAPGGGSAYEQIPGCWGGPARPPGPGAGLTPGRLWGSTDRGHERIPGAPEARSPCEQSPAAKSKDAGRTHKVGSVGGGVPSGSSWWEGGPSFPPFLSLSLSFLPC